MTTTEAQDKKIEILFSSKSPNYSISNTPILIPIKLKRYGLSQVINHLLSLDNPVPFDFIIGEKFLVGSIEAYLDLNGLSTENILHIEFIELSLPPKKSSSLLQDDWISSVAINENSSLFLSGSFDGAVRIWNDQGKLVDSIIIEKSSIKAVAWLNQDVALVGDSTSFIYAFKTKEDTSAGESTVQTSKLFKCSAHEGGISNISINSDATKFASASWDKTIKIWSATTDDCVVASAVVKTSNKKQKVVPEMEKAELLTFSSHSGPVSSVLFDPFQNSSLFSGSWDHSVRLWDLEQKSNVVTLNCEKVVVSMTYCKELKLLVTGHEDGVMRLWDLRSRDGAVVKQKLPIHKNWISSLSPSPSQGFHIASASYDGTVKVTDIRSTIPLYSLAASEDKLFSVDWKRNLLLTGGEDSKLHIYSQ